MKLVHKICVIVIACLLVLGVVCLAFGILLGGSVADVITYAANRLTNLVDILFRQWIV